MDRYWYDTQTGLLVQFESPQFAPSEEDHHLVPLGLLLDGPDFRYERGDRDKVDFSSWGEEDYVAHGKRILSAVNSGETEQDVTHTHLMRAYILGIGPEPKQFSRRFGSIPAFKEVIGSPQLSWGRYANWSIQDYVAYARGIRTLVGRKPVDEDYDAAAKRGEGPSYITIHRRLGGVTKLHEYLGYPNIREWDDLDFLSWGVDVLGANPDTGIKRYVADALSQRKQGPSTRTIVNRFGSLGRFQWLVEAEVNRRTATRQAKLDHYTNLADEESLTPQNQLLQPTEVLAMGGRYVLAEACVPDIAKAQRLEIASSPSKQLITLLRRLQRSLTVDFIEKQAVYLDVFDDIWPADDDLQRFMVSAEEIAAQRRR